MSFTEKEILRSLNIPMLDEPYINFAGARMHVYRNSTSWALAVETIGYYSRMGGPCISHTIHYSGVFEHFRNMVKTDEIVHDEEISRLYHFHPDPIGDNAWGLNSLKAIQVRGKRFDLETFQGKDGPTILRQLLSQEPDLFFATEDELRIRISTDLALFLRLYEWNHPDIRGSGSSGKSETFQQIALALEYNDKSFYQPSLKPNTHWQNWPKGGDL